MSNQLHTQIEQGQYINAAVFAALDEATQLDCLDAAAKHLIPLVPKHMHVYRGGSHVALINDNAGRSKRVAIITER